MTARPVRPTSGAERIEALDAMRGVAILGVLLAYTVWNLGGPPPEAWSGADRIVAGLMDLLVDGKFLTMFAVLFGVGLAQQWRRWQNAARDPVPFHLRRMGFLLGAGLLDGVLLRNGDILAPYALLGLALLGFRRRSSRTLLAAAGILVVTPSLLEILVPAAGLSWPPRPTGGGRSYLAENLAWLRYWYLTNPLRSWPTVLGLMLAGVVVARTGLIERLAGNRALAGRVLGSALTLAVLARLLLQGLSAGGAHPIALRLGYQLGVWTLAAAYGAGLLLVSQSRVGTAVLRPFRAVGRMAFTNYLLQGLLVVPFCLAFGLFDRVTPLGGLWIALGVAALQIPFSVWWLRRREMGPLERVWRGVTYGRRGQLVPAPAEGSKVGRFESRHTE